NAFFLIFCKCFCFFEFVDAVIKIVMRVGVGAALFWVGLGECALFFCFGSLFILSFYDFGSGTLSDIYPPF
ncbi:MAG TPA: hypothetical protein DDX91_07460, partial [Ruminococcaceae bacterium]|nr:hypothetical protein [Oscillospiraceae bacterium]